MKIQFERSGGLMGLHTTATFDTDSLAPAEGQRLRELIAAAVFFDLPAQLSNPDATLPDQFHYKVTIMDEERTHTIETTDSDAPAALQPLLRHLTLLARRS